MINKNIKLILAVVMIVAVIWYIESTKPVINKKTENISVGVVSNTVVTSIDRTKILAEKARNFTPAVEIIPGGGFINTPPFKLKDLIGKKVILVDFWTYSCINCLRTLPYLKNWYSKYEDAGLVIVGVHTPEFDFEKDYANVSSTVKKLGIEYPVVQDNNYATWAAYNNQYWPHEYLIDIDGYVVDDHIGEGGYDQTEKAIQAALSERADVLNLPKMGDVKIEKPADAIDVTPTGVASPETHFGSTRNIYLSNGTKGMAGIQDLVIPETIGANSLYLGGRWNFQDQYASNQISQAEIDFRYSSKNVYFVASSDLGIDVEVILDGKPLARDMAGEDVHNGVVSIKENRLYSLVKGSSYGEHILKLIVKNRGLRAFTFTFG